MFMRTKNKSNQSHSGIDQFFLLLFPIFAIGKWLFLYGQITCYYKYTLHYEHTLLFLLHDSNEIDSISWYLYIGIYARKIQREYSLLTAYLIVKTSNSPFWKKSKKKIVSAGAHMARKRWKPLPKYKCFVISICNLQLAWL